MLLRHHRNEAQYADRGDGNTEDPASQARPGKIEFQ